MPGHFKGLPNGWVPNGCLQATPYTHWRVLVFIVHPQFEDDSSSQDGDHDMATDSLAAARTSDFEDQKEERLEESPLSGDKMFDPDRYVKWKKPKIQYKPSFLEKYKKTMAFETYIKLVRNHMELRIKRLIKDRENKEIQRLQVKRNPNIWRSEWESESEHLSQSVSEPSPTIFSVSTTIIISVRTSLISLILRCVGTTSIFSSCIDMISGPLRTSNHLLEEYVFFQASNKQNQVLKNRRAVRVVDFV